MNEPSDGVPELIAIYERSKRATAEFCNNQQDGRRCVLTKGHAGMHESLANEGINRWSSLSESASDGSALLDRESA